MIRADQKKHERQQKRVIRDSMKKKVNPHHNQSSNPHSPDAQSTKRLDAKYGEFDGRIIDTEQDDLPVKSDDEKTDEDKFDKDDLEHIEKIKKRKSK